MLIVITTFLLSSVLNAVMIGTFAFVLFGENLQKAKPLKGILYILIMAVICDHIITPGLMELDIYFKICNNQITEFFHMQDKLLSLTHIASFRWYDIFIWSIEATIAYYSGRSLYNGAFRRNLTSGSI